MKKIFLNLSRSDLIKEALKNNEGVLSSNGALCVNTRERTGRSPNSKFIVKDKLTENVVNWGKVNKSISKNKFDRLWNKVKNFLEKKDKIYISNLYAVKDKKNSILINIKTEKAWHNLFAKNLFIESKKKINVKQRWKLVDCPSFICDPYKDFTYDEAAIIIDFSDKKILICGTHYAGEIKKSVFSVLNFILPRKKILSMHCSSNIYKDRKVSLFFGLSGTGKTTLSADYNFQLIGDDEHGWSEDGIFNFEGGCYAKCINLSKAKEPFIWNAIKEKTIIENVVLDNNKNPNYNDNSITDNIRVAYSIENINSSYKKNIANHPNNIFFLTCDLYGVLPPISKLNLKQSLYHFLSGYTALVGSTEIGSSKDITPVFSPCFGAPFFPLHPKIYSNILKKYLLEKKVNVYLINTGWKGGSYKEGGERFEIKTTRLIIKSVLENKINFKNSTILPGFNLLIPKNIDGIDNSILDPRKCWKNLDIYNYKLSNLIKKFEENYKSL